MAKSTQIASRGVEFKLNSNPFPRTGYTLLGWNQDWRSDEVEYEDEARVTFDGDRDLYALWQINQYWVMFNANGGTGGWLEPRKMEYGAEVTAPEVIRTGHTFVEWSPPAPETVPPNDITCVAQWQVNQYRVTFDANGGSGGWSQLQDYGSAIVPPEVTRGGYEFIEWQPSVDATVPDSDVEYVAQWQRLSCTVYFDAQGGVGGTSQATLNYGAAMPTIELPTRTGYIFGGYFTEPDGQGTQYYSAQGRGMGAWNETSDTILYARWIEDWVTITMDDNAPEELVVTFNSSTASDGISVTFDSGLRENEINVTFATDGVPNPIHVRFTDDNQAT